MLLCQGHFEYVKSEIQLEMMKEEELAEDLSWDIYHCQFNKLGERQKAAVEVQVEKELEINEGA
jgi:hypothetical protein